MSNKKTKCELTTGFEQDDTVILEIAPTMKTLIYRGEMYHRVDNTVRNFSDGTAAVVYLKSDFGKEFMRRSVSELS